MVIPDTLNNIKNGIILIMQADTLTDNLKYLADAGSVTINIDQRQKIELALDQVQLAYSFEHMFLWGKINGK